MASVMVLMLCLYSNWGFAQATSVGEKHSHATAPAEVGSWTAPVMICPPDGNCLVGANLALLRTGQVLFYYYPLNGSGPGSRAATVDPVSNVVTDALLTAKRNIFCSAITILADGRVMATGGNNSKTHIIDDGTVNTTIFDPATGTWTLAHDMANARWYPTSIELGDGTVLEFAGANVDGSATVDVIERYDYNADTWTSLPAAANMPAATLDGTEYPRLTLMTNGKLFLSLPKAQSYMFNPVRYSWKASATMNFGDRYFAPHVLLSDLHTLMVAGGNSMSKDMTGFTTNTVETIDLSADAPTWKYAAPMNSARMNANLVLLADGKVLAVGGGNGGRYLNPVFTSEMYDPATGQWTVMAAQTAPRTYHSTAALLPDGRVISSGADDGGPLQESYEIYSPPYLFLGARPVISSTPPAGIPYNKTFSIPTPDAASITKVALIRAGATTHADAMDQRYVPLTFTIGTGKLTAKGPLNSDYAPPGYYMLVIINSNGVPSVMPLVKLM